VCAYCLHPEPPYCTWFCHGYCQRFFHDECKELLFSGINASSELQKKHRLAQQDKSTWICNDCLESKAQCFCCKQKGIILLFPKKGKPKTAESLENPLTSVLEDDEGDDDVDNYDDNLDDEDLDADIDQADDLDQEDEEARDEL
jgi:hypothetical protein